MFVKLPHSFFTLKQTSHPTGIWLRGNRGHMTAPLTLIAKNEFKYHQVAVEDSLQIHKKQPVLHID